GRGNGCGDADNKEGQWVPASNGVRQGRRSGSNRVRQAVGSSEGWLRLRWLQREEDEEGMAGGDCDSNDRGIDALQQQEGRRCYCASMGKKKEWVAAAK
ncbi:hypothetical protein BHE74_00015523, partial [Ensete ventricosum]